MFILYIIPSVVIIRNISLTNINLGPEYEKLFSGACRAVDGPDRG
jgi:hypothetical protein